MRRATISRWVVGEVVVLAALALSACGDKPQTAGTASKKHDAKASDGAANTAYTAPGWKQGDPASWEQEMKARNLNQNEYTRTR